MNLFAETYTRFKCCILLFLVTTTSATSLFADVFVAGLNAIDRSHYASAYRSFKPLAEEGISEAHNNLGFQYENGLGVKRKRRIQHLNLV